MKKHENLDYDWRFWLMVIAISPFMLAAEIGYRYYQIRGCKKKS